MLDNWPKSCCDDRSLEGCRFDRPAVGVCYDIGRISSGRYGQKCWETLWRAVESRDVARSLLFEGYVLGRDNVYCLAIYNDEAWRIENVMNTMEKNADFLKICASPHFYEGEDIIREPLAAAGQVNETGNIIGISYNARLALSQVRREKMAASPQEVIPHEAWQAGSKTISPSVKVPPAVTASLQDKKWWHAWR